MTDAHKIMTAERIPLDAYTRALLTSPVNQALIQKNNYDKFGDGDYIDVETISRILNETFGHVWSWEIIDYKHINPGAGTNGEYVVCHGRLSVPGVGMRDGIGQAKADKKDNSTMYSSAASFALKSAAKRFGIAPNLFDKHGWSAGVDVFQTRPQRKAAPQAAPAQAEVTTGSVAPPKPEPADLGTLSDVDHVTPPVPEKKVPKTAAEKGAELKAAYKIQTIPQFIAFAQIWNPEITDFGQINGEVMDKLHAYVENNPEEFEDYKASDY